MYEVFNIATLGSLWVCVVIAVAASSISILITQTELFAPWRAWTLKVHPMLGYLFRCFYCLSHWVVFLGIAVYRPVVIDSGRLLIDLIPSAFFTITLSTLSSGLMSKAFFTVMAKGMREAKIKAEFSGSASSSEAR